MRERTAASSFESLRVSLLRTRTMIGSRLCNGAGETYEREIPNHSALGTDRLVKGNTIRRPPVLRASLVEAMPNRASMNKSTDSPMIRSDLPPRLHPTFVRAAGRGCAVHDETPHGEDSGSPLSVGVQTLVGSVRARARQSHLVRLFKGLRSPIIHPRAKGEGTDQRLLMSHRHAYVCWHQSQQ